MDHQDQSTRRGRLARIPNEIRLIITDMLDVKDISRMLLTCRENYSLFLEDFTKHFFIFDLSESSLHNLAGISNVQRDRLDYIEIILSGKADIDKRRLLAQAFVRLKDVKRICIRDPKRTKDSRGAQSPGSPTKVFRCVVDALDAAARQANGLPGETYRETIVQKYGLHATLPCYDGPEPEIDVGRLWAENAVPKLLTGLESLQLDLNLQDGKICDFLNHSPRLTSLRIYLGSPGRSTEGTRALEYLALMEPTSGLAWRLLS